MSKSPRLNTPPGCMALFLMPFALGFVLMDVVAARGIAEQLATLSYASVPGTITHSEVTYPDSNFRFDVRYTYEVEGRKYAGSRYRLGEWRVGRSRSSFAKLQERFPEGSAAQVLYRPEAPQESVLLRGVEGFDLFLLLLLSLFNLGIFGGIYAMMRSRKIVPEGIRSFVKDGRTHARLVDFSPAEAGFFTAGLANIVALMAVGALAGGFDAPLPVVALAWVAVVASGLVVAVRRRARWKAGDYELIVDPRRRTVSLPPMFGRERRIEVPWSQIRSLVVQKREGRNSQGKTYQSYHPLLEFIDKHGQVCREALGPGGTNGPAQDIVRWLQSRVEVGPPGGPPG